MATDVTVLGAAGSTVTVSFASAVNAAAAQAALGVVSDLAPTAIYTTFNYPGTGTVPALPPGKFAGSVVVTVAGGGSLGLVPTGYVATVVNTASLVAMVGNFSANQTVVASGTGTTQFLNISQNTQVFFGGGNNYFANSYDNTTAVINVDGFGSSTVPGAPAAQADYIDASHGAATINVFSGPFVDVQGGGHNIVNLMAGGTDVVGIAGSSTVATTINGTAGANLTYVNQGGAAFINLGASNATVFGSTANTPATGTQSVFGGTGTLTALGITGYAKGGSGGGNTMTTTSLTSGTTLVGNGAGDQLFANFGGVVLQAGSGNETLLGSFSTVAGSASIGGATFIGGTDGAATNLIVGNLYGNNTIGVGSGTSTVFGQGGAHDSATHNTFYEASHGGVHLIEDFFGSDTFKLSASLGTPSITGITTITAAGSQFNVAGSKVTLSDGTTLVFNSNFTINNNNFS